MNNHSYRIGLFFCILLFCIGCSNPSQETISAALHPWTPPSYTSDEQQLADKVKAKGWLAFSARSENGTWDIFLSRPDGSHQINITNTNDTEEAAPVFSPDGTKLLFRRIAKGTEISHDQYGFQGQLIMADANGSNARVLGKDSELAWADWSPDGTQISCLTQKEIQFLNVDTLAVAKTLPRQGIYQQLCWSPDGKAFCGTANHGGVSWTVVKMDIETNALNVIMKFQNCTPDWFPDSQRVIYSSRPPDQSPDNKYGWTQLWMANADGSNHQLVFGEDGFHIYGGLISPDGNYVVFSKSDADGGGSEREGAPLFLMRLSDSPIIHGDSKDLRSVHPNTNDGPALSLPHGWEPSWTDTEIEIH